MGRPVEWLWIMRCSHMYIKRGYSLINLHVRDQAAAHLVRQRHEFVLSLVTLRFEK